MKKRFDIPANWVPMEMALFHFVPDFTPFGPRWIRAIKERLQNLSNGRIEVRRGEIDDFDAQLNIDDAIAYLMPGRFSAVEIYDGLRIDNGIRLAGSDNFLTLASEKPVGSPGFKVLWCALGQLFCEMHSNMQRNIADGAVMVTPVPHIIAPPRIRLKSFEQKDALQAAEEWLYRNIQAKPTLTQKEAYAAFQERGPAELIPKFGRKIFRTKLWGRVSKKHPDLGMSKRGRKKRKN